MVLIYMYIYIHIYIQTYTYIMIIIVDDADGQPTMNHGEDSKFISAHINVSVYRSIGAFMYRFVDVSMY